MIVWQDAISIWLSNPANVIGMIGTAASTFFAAILAFWFGIRLYRHQKSNENLGYLQYAASTLAATVNHLYTFKKDMVIDRFEEAQRVSAQLRQSTDSAGLHLNLKHIFFYMHAPGFPWTISHERLDFVANREPNLILILGTASSSLATLNSIILGINKVIEKSLAGRPPMEEVFYLIENTKILGEQVDSTLYLVEKTFELFSEYGRLEFGKKMKIKSCDIADGRFKALKPAPIQSWESTDWFPKKAWYQRLSRWIKVLALVILI